MESDDSLLDLIDIELEYPTLTPSTLRHPILAYSNIFFATIDYYPVKSRFFDAQSDIVLLTQELFTVAACTVPSAMTVQSQPAKFLLLSGTVEQRFHILAMHVPDPKGDFAACENMQKRIMKIWAGLQLPDSIKQSTSLVWLE